MRTIGTAKEQIASYYNTNIEDTLLTYEDGELQALGNPVATAFSVTSDGVNYTDAQLRPEALSQFNNKVSITPAGLDYRLRFFSAVEAGDGTSLLESFRAFMHKRLFVGTLLPAVTPSGGGGGGGGDAVVLDSLTNTSPSTLQLGRLIRMTPAGITYSDASSVATAEGTLGVLLNNVTTGSQALIVGNGVAPNVLTGLGFAAGDQVYLGLNGQLVNEATATAFPPGYVIQEVGTALNTNDLFVLINPLEII